MNEKPISPEFSSNSGERELEIFLLSDNARKEFQKTQDRDAAELTKLRSEQQARHAEDVRAAKIAISAERPKPEPAPKGRQPRKALKEPALQALAEHRVDTQNTASRNALTHQQRTREDAFLAKQKEERLLREAQESRAVPDRTPPPSLKRDFEKSR